MKPALVRLFVALFSLLASILELGASLVQLGVALTLRAAAAVRPRPEAAQAPRNLCVVPPSGRPAREKEERLTAALVGLGWSAPTVRRFVAGLGDRVGREPIEKLIKEGLATLAA